MSRPRTVLKETALAFLPRAVLKLPYELILTWLPSLERSFPEIETIYLLRSLTGSDWLPGASDVDVLIVITEMPRSEEERFLERFHRSFDLIRRICPLLGKTIGIYTRRELEAYLTRGDIRAHDARTWRLLAGRRIALPENVSEPAKISVDALSEALIHHSRLHERWLYGSPILGRAEARDMVKAISDILRYGALAAEPGSELPARAGSLSLHGPRALEQAVLRRLEDLVSTGYAGMRVDDVAALMEHSTLWLEACSEKALRRFPALDEPCVEDNEHGILDGPNVEMISSFHRSMGGAPSLWHNRLYLIRSLDQVGRGLFEKLRAASTQVRQAPGCHTPLVIGPRTFSLGQRTLFYQQYGFIKDGLWLNGGEGKIVRSRIAAGVPEQLRNRVLHLPALARERYGSIKDDGKMFVTEYLPKLFHALNRGSVAPSESEGMLSLRALHPYAADSISRYAAAADERDPRSIRGLELAAILDVAAALDPAPPGVYTGQPSQVRGQ